MSYEQEIKELRKEIDRLNVEIIDRIKERVDVAIQIGAVKHRYDMPVVDPAREKIVYERARELAEQRGVDPDAIERIFREIVQMCVNAEEDH